LNATESSAPSTAGAPAPSAVEGLIATAAAQRPAWRTMALRLPAPRGPVALTVDEGDGGQPQKRGTLTLDATTGAIVRWEGPAELSAGRRARSWLRFAHTGEVYGLVGQTIAGVASLAGAVLVYTGIALAFRRWLAWWRRRNTPVSRDQASRTAA
ncbi:MAG: PepSY-associated TM helix domain-containing protein, partial [Vicinamibacterales bacterium]